jgi:hypothetical protein
VSASLAVFGPLQKGLLIMEEDIHLRRQEVYGNFLTLPLNFTVNLKLLSKNSL